MSDAERPDQPPAETALVRDLAGFPERVARLVAGRSQEDLCRPSQDGGWGVVENLCHLRDWDEILQARVEAIVRDDRPELPAFDDSLWEVERSYRSQDPQKVLAQFHERRRQIVDILDRLDTAGWERSGFHADLGLVTLRWLAGYYRDHDRAHEAQIREALG